MSPDNMKPIIVFLMRAILLVGCILIIFSVLFYTVLYVEVAELLDIFELPGPSRLTYVRMPFLVILAVVGALGVYKQRSDYLKLFAIVLVVQSILDVCISSYTFPSRRAEFNQNYDVFRSRFQDFCGDHNLDLKVDEKVTDEETRVMEKMHNLLFCCGFKGPEDWRYWAPMQKRREAIIPRSCCVQFVIEELSGGRCYISNMDHVKKVGCHSRMQALIVGDLSIEMYGFISDLVLAAMATFLAKHYDRMASSAAKSSNNSSQVLNSKIFNGPIHYRRGPLNGSHPLIFVGAPMKSRAQQADT